MKTTLATPVAKPKLLLDLIATKEASLKIRAIRHKLRQQILSLIHKNKKMQVTSIYKKLHLEQSVASTHLAILREANFVLTQREGAVIYYSVNYQEIQKVQETLKRITK